MNSVTWLLSGAGCVAGALAFPPAGIPLLVGGIVCGLVAEHQRKEEEFWLPVVQLEQDALLDQAEQAVGYWAVEQDFLLETEHNQAMSQNAALLLTLEGRIQQQERQMKSAAPQPEQQQLPAPPAQVTAVEQAQPVSQLVGHELPEDPWSEAEYVPVDGVQPASQAIQTEDIAALIARNSLDRENCSSILIACPRGTGKSNLLRAALTHLHRLSNGQAKVSIFNGNESRDDQGQIVSTFCGLEHDPKHYINAGDAYRIEKVVDRLQGITAAMETNYSVPMVTVLDEYNNQLVAAEIAASLDRKEQAMLPFKERMPTPNYAEEIGLSTVLRITKGRFKLCSDWITSHSPLVQDIGLNTKIQQSLTVVVLGRSDKLDALHSALSGAQAVVKNPQTRADLYKQFLAWEQGQHDREKAICLTNLAGGWRLVFLPKYPDQQPEVYAASSKSASIPN